MKIIVVGCGRMGSDLAYRFNGRGHEVAVVDYRASAFDALPSDFSGRIVEGDAMNPDVLHRAGITECDALAAVTSQDATNVVIAHLARQKYKVPHVVTRNFNPNYRKLYEIFNLQGVCATGWASQRLEEMIYHGETQAVFSTGNGEVEIYQIVIPQIWNGKSLEDVFDGATCIPVSITRAGKSFLPMNTTSLQKGDVVHFSATVDGVKIVRNRLGLDEEV